MLGFEGVRGLENTRWFHNEYDFMALDLSLCFTRLLAGTMDYSPGAMDNYPIGKYKGNVEQSRFDRHAVPPDGARDDVPGWTAEIFNDAAL